MLIIKYAINNNCDNGVKFKVDNIKYLLNKST